LNLGALDEFNYTGGLLKHPAVPNVYVLLGNIKGFTDLSLRRSADPSPLLDSPYRIPRSRKEVLELYDAAPRSREPSKCPFHSAMH
jgi:hypothetical protein